MLNNEASERQRCYDWSATALTAVSYSFPKVDLIATCKPAEPATMRKFPAHYRLPFPPNRPGIDAGYCARRILSVNSLSKFQVCAVVPFAEIIQRVTRERLKTPPQTRCAILSCVSHRQRSAAFMISLDEVMIGCVIRLSKRANPPGCRYG
jgi:hypothetical protein